MNPDYPWMRFSIGCLYDLNIRESPATRQYSQSKRVKLDEQHSDWFDLLLLAGVLAFQNVTFLEMKRYEREHQRLQILNEIVENSQSFRVSRVCDIDERPDLRSLV